MLAAALHAGTPIARICFLTSAMGAWALGPPDHLHSSRKTTVKLAVVAWGVEMEPPRAGGHALAGSNLKLSKAGPCVLVVDDRAEPFNGLPSFAHTDLIKYTNTTANAAPKAQHPVKHAVMSIHYFFVY